MRLPLIACLLLLVSAPPVGAQGGTGRGGRDSLWRRGLEDAPALTTRIEELADLLAAGSARDLLAIAAPGAIKLQIQPLRAPARLTGRLQARALLRAYFEASAPGVLRIAQAHLDAGGASARVSLLVQGGATIAGQPLRRRFVAGLELVDGAWLLTELRCP